MFFSMNFGTRHLTSSKQTVQLQQSFSLVKSQNDIRDSSFGAIFSDYRKFILCAILRKTFSFNLCLPSTLSHDFKINWYSCKIWDQTDAKHFKVRRQSENKKRDSGYTETSEPGPSLDTENVFKNVFKLCLWIAPKLIWGLDLLFCEFPLR